MDHASRFKDKRILVLGGTRGIGAATALAFLREGARVCIGGTREESVAAFLQQNRFDRLSSVIGSIGSRAETTKIVTNAIAQLGGLDILVNSAGIFDEQPFATMDQDHWDKMVRVNLEGAAFSCQTALPTLIKSGGNIVTLASDAGLVAYPSSIAYCIAKSGVVALTRCLALEYAKQVRVNCVCPSNVDTDMIRIAAQRAGNREIYLDAASNYAPMGRMALPTEVADAILYLASDAAAFITGVALPVDGGRCCL